MPARDAVLQKIQQQLEHPERAMLTIKQVLISIGQVVDQQFCRILDTNFTGKAVVKQLLIFQKHGA